MINLQKLQELMASEKVFLTSAMLTKFDMYADFMVKYNLSVNLTAIVEPTEIVIKHFCDSLLLLKYLDIPNNASLIDVGTGAGFPAVPLKIARDDIDVTLLDSQKKRIIFLVQLSTLLRQKNDIVHSRAEIVGEMEQYREKFDIATARAVAHMRELAEYCLPFVKVGGYFVALKGPDIEDELNESQKAIELLGGELSEVKKYILPRSENQEDYGRSLVIIKKVSQMSTKYPRPSAKIAKFPLK